MKTLSQSQVDARLEHREGWVSDETGSMIQKEFTFQDFADAMVFINKVGEKAEEHEHHPDMCISYNQVVCMLTTHDRGGLTEKDFKMAQAIDELLA